MRLSITTFKIFKDWDLDTLCEELPKAKVEGIEFRIGGGHKHGIEITMSQAERKAAQQKLADAGLTCCSIASGYMFHWPEPATLREHIEGAKQAILLAHDLGAPRVRVFGNNIPEGADPDDVAAQVGRALRELGRFAEPLGIEVLLEMHGDFNDWWLNKRAVGFANHRNVRTLYNWDKRDLVKGSVGSVWQEMKSYIRHIHFHDLKSDTFPHKEMFDLLAEDGYSGFMSMEVSMDGDVVRNLHEQAGLFFEMKEGTTK